MLNIRLKLELAWARLSHRVKARWAYLQKQRKCEHDDGRWYMHDLGMGKGRYCTKCGKCLEIWKLK